MQEAERIYHMAVLGRTLEHLGVQMYKRRDTAIAELVANCWDAGAEHVWIEVPGAAAYSPASSTIVIEDTGVGMTPDQVEDDYLVLGRNRRSAGAPTPPGRAVMGRKGIGKLAGFGIASKMDLLTWRDDIATQITLDVAQLKLEPKSMANVAIPGRIFDPPADVRSPQGTRLTLRTLKQASPPDIAGLREALARRFSRTVRGHMAIEVNGEVLTEPSIDFAMRVPADGQTADSLEDGNSVSYYYGFSRTTLKSRELRGITIYVNGKTAQAPPFFFDVESTASGQHGTKYLIGAVEADFLDAGVDDESDVISTDRQEIDWERPDTTAFYSWGQELTRRALREYRDERKKTITNKVLSDPGLRDRIDRLDPASKKQVERFLGLLGLAEADEEQELELASNLIAAYEYRNFHDFIDQLEDVGDDPEQLHLLLKHMMQWKVLEGRAVLEVIKGRLSIVERFHAMIVNDAPETAHRVGDANMHDLLADYPWLIHPEWQVLSEETTISRQLIEWARSDLAEQLTEEEARQRYDFLALVDPSLLVIVEIKRSGYTVELDDLLRLLKYKANLERAHATPIVMVLVSSGNYAFDTTSYQQMTNLHLLTWAAMHERSSAYYRHYEAVLEGDVESSDFHRKSVEVARTRSVLEHGAYRGRALRSEGLGPQDAPDYKAIWEHVSGEGTSTDTPQDPPSAET